MYDNMNAAQRPECSNTHITRTRTLQRPLATSACCGLLSFWGRVGDLTDERAPKECLGSRGIGAGDPRPRCNARLAVTRRVTGAGESVPCAWRNAPGSDAILCGRYGAAH